MPSGGTLASVFTIMDVYSLKEIAAANLPYAISPIPGPKTSSGTSLVTKLFGIRSVPDLGILSTSLGGIVDTPIVQRSWGILGYGPNFHFAEYMKVRNYLIGIAVHWGLLIGSLLLAIPLVRTIARKYVYQPGEGPTKDQVKNDRLEYRGIARPDVQTPNPGRAFCRAFFDGSLYACKSSRS
jgi:hypothetical protein